MVKYIVAVITLVCMAVNIDNNFTIIRRSGHHQGFRLQDTLWGRESSSPSRNRAGVFHRRRTVRDSLQQVDHPPRTFPQKVGGSTAEYLH